MTTKDCSHVWDEFPFEESIGQCVTGEHVMVTSRHWHCLLCDQRLCALPTLDEAIKLAEAAKQWRQAERTQARTHAAGGIFRERKGCSSRFLVLGEQGHGASNLERTPRGDAQPSFKYEIRRAGVVVHLPSLRAMKRSHET